MAEDAAQLVVADLADEGGLATQARDPDRGVGGRPAGNLDPRAHGGIQLFGALGVDQGHRALGHAHPRKEAVLAVGEHVHDGIADADDVDDFRHKSLLKR